MTLSELAEVPTNTTIVLTNDEARAIAETYQDACDRCHVLAEQLVAANGVIERLTAEAATTRVALAAALAPKAAA